MSDKTPLEPCLEKKHPRNMSGKTTLEPCLEKNTLEPCLEKNTLEPCLEKNNLRTMSGEKTHENHVWEKTP